MEAKELRIGNYVLQDDEVINGITSNSIHKFDLGLIRLEPIPLTEEWLLKFGFKPLPFKNILNSYTIEIGKKRIISVGNVGTANEMIWLCKINNTYEQIVDDLVCLRNYDYDKRTYIHQLQNIFFCLTEEELTIKNQE